MKILIFILLFSGLTAGEWRYPGVVSSGSKVYAKSFYLKKKPMKRGEALHRKVELHKTSEDLVKREKYRSSVNVGPQWLKFQF